MEHNKTTAVLTIDGSELSQGIVRLFEEEGLPYIVHVAQDRNLFDPYDALPRGRIVHADGSAGEIFYGDDIRRTVWQGLKRVYENPSI